MRHSPWRGVNWWAGVLALTLSLGVVGCGAPSGSVTGKVYVKNKLLKGGTVTFLTADKQVSQLSKITEDGSYSIDRMPVGAVKIAVETKSLKQAASAPRYSPPPGMKSPNNSQPDPKELLRRYILISDMYANPETSGLGYTIQAGAQVYDIKLP